MGKVETKRTAAAKALENAEAKKVAAKALENAEAKKVAPKALESVKETKKAAAKALENAEAKKAAGNVKATRAVSSNNNVVASSNNVVEDDDDEEEKDELQVQSNTKIAKKRGRPKKSSVAETNGNKRVYTSCEDFKRSKLTDKYRNPYIEDSD
jgi:hypothetical protein